MCDRFVYDSTREEIAEVFQVSSERKDYFEPDYNIIPGQLIPAVFNDENENTRSILKFHWGLIPEEAETEEQGKEHYEFPSEKIEEDDRIKSCVEMRRCLIPANGFYKWKTTKKKTTPFYIRLLSNEVMAFAGVYSVWEAESGREVYSCTLLTTEANVLVQPVDDRMPVIIRRENYPLWLGEEPVTPKELEAMLQPYRLTEMAVNRVSEKVNNITNNSPELIQPIPK